MNKPCDRIKPEKKNLLASAASKPKGKPFRKIRKGETNGLYVLHLMCDEEKL